MQDFYPDEVFTTGVNQQEMPITVVGTPPEITSANDDKALQSDENPPKYMATATIEVKRYWLKK